jgi:hypothetical protein
MWKENPVMKSLARRTFILLFLFVIAPTASRADSVVVGSFDLINTTPGPNGVDTLLLTNVTPGGGAANIPLESLTFSNVDLTIDGVDQTSNLLADAPGFYYELDSLAQDSITSFELTLSLGSSPLLVTVNGQQNVIDPTVYLSYSGSVLDTNSNSDVQFDIDVTVTPEPSTLWLSGTGLALLGVLLWSRRRRQVSYAGAGRFITGIA